RYDQLDINLARLYQMQRGDLPTTGEISFVVEAGALVSSSSSYRPETRFVYKFDYKSSPAKREYIDMTSWILIWHVYIRCKEGICQRLEKSVL
ncbi:hypothetical protein, partial [Escherichia coli]